MSSRIMVSSPTRIIVSSPTSPEETVAGLLAMAKDAALDALERRKVVAWVGGPVPSPHQGKLLVASPVEKSGGSYWAVRNRAANGHWFFSAPTVGADTMLSPRLRLVLPGSHFLWTLRRVQNAVARSYGLLQVSELPENVLEPITLELPNKDQARARRREKRRQRMSPAEKEQFDQHSWYLLPADDAPLRD